MKSYAQPQTRSVLGAFARGLAFTAITGALMAGIFSGVGAAAFAMGLSTSAVTLGASLSSMAMVAVSTGIFGGLLQAYGAFNHNNKVATTAPMRSSDVAITAASNNLLSPQMQRALAPSTPSVGMDTPALDNNPTTSLAETPKQTSFTEQFNRGLVARDKAVGFAERELARREQATTLAKQLG